MRHWGLEDTKTLHVDQVSGNDGNSGLTYALAKATIAGAIADANGINGSTIIVWPGTYDEAVNLAVEGKGPTTGWKLIGVDRESCIISPTTGTPVGLGSGCYMSDLTLTGQQSEEAIVGCLVLGDGILIDNCIINGKYDGLAVNGYNFVIRNSYITGTYDGATFNTAGNAFCENCYFFADGSWDSGSKPARAATRGVSASKDLCTFRDCKFRVAKTITGAGEIASVFVGGMTNFKNCTFEVVATHGDFVQAVSCVKEDPSSTFTNQTMLDNCSFLLSNAGSGDSYHIVQGSGIVICKNSYPTLVSGTIKRPDVPQTGDSYAILTHPEYGLGEIADLINAIAVGDGSVVVDHDYGGADALAYKTEGGAGIDNAVVRAYLKSDYDAGNTGSEYVKATTTTDVNGRWTNQMNLDPATYTLYYFKQGAYGPDTQEVTVT